MVNFPKIEPSEYSPSLRILGMNLINDGKIMHFQCLIDEKEYSFGIERKGEDGIVLPPEIIDIVTETMDRSRLFGSIRKDFFSGKEISYPVDV